VSLSKAEAFGLPEASKVIAAEEGLSMGEAAEGAAAAEETMQNFSDAVDNGGE
jgi:hypothetical protein